MASIYLFALILGGGLLGISLLGDLFGGADVELDTDLDLDLDLDMDLEPGEVGSAVGPAGGVAADATSTDVASATRIFSLRNLTYFLFGFGAVGWILGELTPGQTELVTAVAAMAGGLLSAGLAAVLFGWVRATESGGQAGEASFVGCDGRVVLPVGHGKTGLIVVRRGEREHELRAVPLDPRANAPERWVSIVVMDMDGGTARVSPVEALAPADSGPADL